MKKSILLLSSALLLFAACNKDDGNPSPGPNTNDPDPKQEDVISISSSLTVDGKPVSYSIQSEFNISPYSLRAGDGSTMRQPTETTIILSSIGVSKDEFFEGKVITAQELKSTWGLQLFTPKPLALYLSRNYDGPAQGTITVTEYDEYQDADGDTKAGKLTLRFDQVIVQDNPERKTINGEITIEKYVY